ncbi:AarF/ABC1/UbiB kinase family protein [Leptolyngbya sp. FACHB-261]|uniref:ABC1 kinase family protein n=1 Tax=Leptolyngbya sp. FACHB-261 TaxID=2692806 RepID=UPI0016862D1E|nr:AarF/ABC1/UbiB kinase family protein [Leptolyngbya sp. FACHB-261]MBD2099289.1 AarF/ABC1/UbiB kinase family protein [Leptolyngbya sp. FACHB-261]
MAISPTVVDSRRSAVRPTDPEVVLNEVVLQRLTQQERVLATGELALESYDPQLVALHYSRQPWTVLRRCVAALWPILTLAFSLWWDKRTGAELRNERRRAIQLRELLTRLGPAYIKIGQALSTRPDLVTSTYLEELAQLQDQLPPFANALAFQFIREELGGSPQDIYAEISADPIAAASLGQVYKGKLKTGEVVAIKVQRPDLAGQITLDMYILRGLAGWIQRRFSFIKSDLQSILDEFAYRIFEEMDYEHEGANAERFSQLYGHIEGIYVPKIYWQYTARRVLTMEWIDGVKLTQLDTIRSKGLDPREIIGVGVQCSLQQLLEHGFFHADPHPGNLFAMNDGKLAYLDFGMMSEVKPEQRYNLIEAIVHIVNRDFEELAQDYVKLDFLTPDVDLRPIVPALASVFSQALGASVSELNIKSITDELSQMMYDYPFRVPAYYALIIRSLVTLEGIAINVDPDFKVLNEAYPYVAKRLLSDPAPQLRSALRDVLFKDGSFRWNRLENLLRNATKGSKDYDLSKAVDQALDFLMSERGEFIRERLIDEIVKGIDPVYVIQGTPNPASEHLQRIWAILQQNGNFDPLKVLPVAGQILFKPETQQLGRRVVSRLAQRTLARLIREFLLREETTQPGANRPTTRSTTGPITAVRPAPALPAPSSRPVQFPRLPVPAFTNLTASLNPETQPSKKSNNRSNNWEW